MKKQIISAVILIALSATAFTACKKKEQPVPAEQEVITTMKLNVTDTANVTRTFIYKIENGFGNTSAGTVQIDTVKLQPNRTYTVTTTLYNEKANPVEDITEEVLAEKEAHLFLFISTPATGAGSIGFTNGSKDANNAPFNQTITFTTGSAGTGTLQVNLMHEPTNKSGLTTAASGGETDAEANFPVKIQ